MSSGFVIVDLVGREKEYQEYLNSKVWYSLRDQRLTIDDYRCRICNRRAECVHHRHYPKVFGMESVNDLTSLCNHCHNMYHNRSDLQEVIKHVDELAQNAGGTDCPVCQRHLQYYKRRITKGMAASLVQLYQYDKENYQEFVHMETYFKSVRSLNHAARGDAAKLVHWGLIELRDAKKATARSSTGYYRITEKGRAFVRKEIAVPEIAIIVRGELQQMSGSDIHIQDVLPFDIAELLLS